MTRPLTVRPPSVSLVSPPVPRTVGAPSGGVPRAAATGKAIEPGGFRAILQTQLVRLSEGERAMESMVRGSVAGRTLGTAELLAMQAGIYRYGQEIELLSRLVDRASGAVKQTLQSQS